MSRKIDSRNFEVIADELAAVLRTKTPAERFRMAGDANDTARLLAAAGIRHVHPNWTIENVQREVARRMLGAANEWEIILG